MKERFYSKSVKIAEETPRIIEVANKLGIVLPSSHTALFHTVYAPIEEANDNGVRLAKKAVEDSLQGLVGAQSNLEHLGAGFMTGIILDASINENNEIETIFTFAKNIYSEDYTRALEKIQEGTLSVSFELLTSKEGQEKLDDGTIRLHDIDFQGQGLLIDETPAYKKALVFDMAKKYKERAEQCSETELVFAKKIVKSCDDLLKTRQEAVEEKEHVILSRQDNHFHIALIDFDGTGESVAVYGENSEKHTHKIVDYQIQASNKHAHSIWDWMGAKDENKQSNLNKEKSVKGGNTKMTKEQKKLVADLREELGDLAKDISDEQLLNEDKVTELRKAKTESENEKSGLEKAQSRIAELEAENAELKATVEAKNSEIEEVRENAEKIGKLKIELKDNPYVADFKDKDYLDENKIEKARMKKENDDLKAQNEDLANKNKEAKEKLKASKNESDEDLPTGHDEEDEDEGSSPRKLIARLK